MTAEYGDGLPVSDADSAHAAERQYRLRDLRRTAAEGCRPVTGAAMNRGRGKSYERQVIETIALTIAVCVVIVWLGSIGYLAYLASHRY